MSTITATSGQPIRVGRKLDNKAVSVTFDLSSLCTEYSPEEVKLAVKRDGDDMAYYASGWTMDGSTGTWIPTSVDLARHSCLVQPILFAADDVVAHGEAFRCIISRSIDDETGDIPAAQSLLIEIGRVSETADEALSTAQSIAESLPDIEQMKTQVSEMYTSLESTNICPLAELKTNPNSTGGTINGNYQLFGHVTEGENYVFSADVVWQPGRLDMRLKRDDGGPNVTGIQYINANTTGRFHKSFVAPADGQIWFSGTMGASDPSTVVWENCQLEHGNTYTEYQPYGRMQVFGSQERRRLSTVEQQIEDIDTFTSNIISVAHQGYTGYGATRNTLKAFKDAKKYGFDWIETDVYPTADGVMLIMHDGKVDTATETNVNVWTVNYADITSPTLKYSDAVNVCSMYGLGMAIELKGTNFNKNRGDYTYLINQVETKNVPHAFLSYNLSNLTAIRRQNKDQEVVLLMNTKPTAEEITTKSSYANFYVILQNGSNAAICFPFTNNPIDQEYVDSLAQIGCGLIAGATETESTLAQYMKFCRMEVNNTIRAKDIIQVYYP
jgi:glycerophosphoryl diester phosphodiesterase